jgi:hypothetical protein
VDVNSADDHVFVLGSGAVLEFGPATQGSPLLDGEVAAGLGISTMRDLAVDGATGNLYISTAFHGLLYVVDPAKGTHGEVLARISGAGSPRGLFNGEANDLSVAVNESNGHVFAFSNRRGTFEEFDRNGSFVGRFGDPFTESQIAQFRIAVDNGASSPNRGDVYIADDDSRAGTPDLWAYGPLSYGSPPRVVTGKADHLGGGEAQLHGTVDPEGFALEACRFEYLTDTDYVANLEAEDPPFAGAASVPCDQSPETIGKGEEAVDVDASLGGLEPEGRYRFRLVAENQYGPSEGNAGLFGPPRIEAEGALPVFYREATLRAKLDPSGLETKYRFQYGVKAGEYDHSTSTLALSPGEKAVALKAALTGLEEGTTYYFRLVAENEAKAPVLGEERSFRTLQRVTPVSCPNSEYRTGLSAKLPDCRAYELVTPAQTNGLIVRDATLEPQSAQLGFNNWLAAPRGPEAGQRLTYFTPGTLPGFEGGGFSDGYRSERGSGAHPMSGWSSQLVSPTYRQSLPQFGNGASQDSVASDQLYSFWHLNPAEVLSGTLVKGNYLRTPGGFEFVGLGDEGTDPDAAGRYVTPGGEHVIFSSKAHLEEGAPAAGTEALYERAAGSSSAQVLSIKPDGSPFSAGEGAEYVGASEDGAAVLFKSGGALFERHHGTTIDIAAGKPTFAGVSAGGERVFYADAGGLFACESGAGSCAGAEATQAPIQIAGAGAVFVEVSADGSHVFFSSKAALTPPGEENDNAEHAEANLRNLYVWNGVGPSFVARLSEADFLGFEAEGRIGIWAEVLNSRITDIGRENSPTRATPSGGAFVFQSHARLSPYDNKGVGEIYRYEPSALSGERLLCISCNPSNAPAGSDAALAEVSQGTFASTLIANVTDDGRRVFFHSPDRLLPEDANSVVDVYEWKENGIGGCGRSGGCLTLISSGQGEGDSYLYGMSADGRDVFLRTNESLVGADFPGSSSIYDAREGGGIPEPSAPEVCRADACQGSASPPRSLPSPGGESGGAGEGLPRKGCAKGTRRVVRQGRPRCAKPRHKRHKRDTNHKRGSGR